MLAKFKCMRCGYKYERKPGPTTCPKCESLYVEWLNWREVVGDE